MAHPRRGTSGPGWQGTGANLVAPVAATQATLLRLRIPRAQLDFLSLKTIERMQLFSGHPHRAERRERPGNLHKADLPVGVTWTKNQDMEPGDKSQNSTTAPQPIRQNRDT